MARKKLTAAALTPTLELGTRRVTVDEDTRQIAVRVAKFGETHSGFGPEVKVPRKANLEAAHVGTAELDDGTEARVAVLPMHTTHANPAKSALHAAAWYEQSGLGVARGRYSEDDEGIRFDGELYDDITDAQLDRLTASSASGDWRSAIAIKQFSDYETTPCDFVGSCIVNIGGFSDTYTTGPAERLALVASAVGQQEVDGIEIIDAGALFASGIGVDGLSTDDVRTAWCEHWRELNPAPVRTVPSSGSDYAEQVGDGPYSYVEDIYIAPLYYIIASVSGPDNYVRADWSVNAGGEIEFGEAMPVERVVTWVLEETDMAKPLTAGGGTCTGDCASCDGKCGGEKAVSLQASAALRLLDGTATDEDRAAARSALIASGAIDVEAEREARLDFLERAAINSIFDAADD